MAERGEYRGIRVVLLWGPDYQKLRPSSKLVLLTLKIFSGPMASQVKSFRSLVADLQETTGLSSKVVGSALAELGIRPWYVHEAGFYMIVGGLKYEPSISPTDPKHRKMVQRYVAGLPRLALVRRFITENADWFPLDERTAFDLGWAFEGPSQGPFQAPRSTETLTLTSTSTLTTTRPAHGPPVPHPPKSLQPPSSQPTAALQPPAPAATPAHVASAVGGDSSPHDNSNDNSNGTTPDVPAYARGLAEAMNGGILAKWGDGAPRVRPSTGTQLAADLIARSIPLARAQVAIATWCVRSKLPAPPRSLEYVRQIAIEAHEAEEERQAERGRATRRRKLATVGDVLSRSALRAKEETEVAYQAARTAAAVAWCKDNPKRAKLVADRVARDNPTLTPFFVGKLAIDACVEHAKFPDVATWIKTRTP